MRLKVLKVVSDGEIGERREGEETKEDVIVENATGGWEEATRLG